MKERRNVEAHLGSNVIYIVEFFASVLTYVVLTVCNTICSLGYAREDSVKNESVWLSRCRSTIFQADQAV
jgi:hypothetical protein